MKKLVISWEKVPVIVSGHPWIFSGAVSHFDPIEPGELVHVVDPSGTFLALAYANPNQSLCARILSYKDEPIGTLLKKRFQQAYDYRKQAGLFTQTDAYRLINAEGDRLGGLIVDVYRDVATIQIGTQGMERLKPCIIEILRNDFQMKTILERSESSSRESEGLAPSCETLFGSLPKTCQIQEYGIVFDIDLEHGQKTGFFLDQRPMRRFLSKLVESKSVLNVFSYTGGFSLHALKNKAKSCVSVDVDKHALDNLDKLIVKNNLDPKSHLSVNKDAFLYLKEEDLSKFDLIILDPPAFAKKRNDIENASKGYKKLMVAALSKMKEGAFLYVASCSYFMDEKTFEKLLIQAGMETKCVLKFISGQIEALDHPRLLSHKEGSYLKGFVVQVFKS